MNDRRQLFVAAYLGAARRNATEAARIAGYQKPGQEGHRLLKIAEVQQAVAEAQDEINQSNQFDYARRLAVLSDLAERHIRLVEARAEGTTDDPIEGGATGLLIRQRKNIGTASVTEYFADTAVTKEIRELLKQIAVERGEWTEKRDQTGNVGVIVRVEYADIDDDDDSGA
jgi:phage terminase small subunit